MTNPQTTTDDTDKLHLSITPLNLLVKTSKSTQQYYKSYYEKNKEIIKLQKKEYYKEHKKIIADKYKIYYEKNKIDIVKKQLEYYEKNKNKINEKLKNNKKHCSLCGCSIIRHNFKKHEQSAKHFKNKKEWLYISKGLNL